MSESGCRKREHRSALKALWALRAGGLKKMLKRSDGGLGSGGEGAENSPQRAAVFCHLFKGIETYEGKKLGRKV